MQPHKHQFQKKTPHSKPSGQWRKKYACKVNKGEHTYKLIKPKWSFLQPETNNLTVKEYYETREQEYKKCVDNGETKRPFYYLGVLYYYKCTACGKEHRSGKKLKL